VAFFALFAVVSGVSDNGAQNVIGTESLPCFLGGVEGIPALMQLVGGVGRFHHQIHVARDQNVLLGHFAFGGEQTLEKRFLLVLSVARHLSSARHFHPEDRIGLPGEG